MTTGAEMERLARELSAAEIVAIRRCPKDRTFWLADRRIARALHFRNIIVTDETADMFTDTGLAVRRILTERPNDADE